jgi:excisionase family DNA binding protein
MSGRVTGPVSAPVTGRVSGLRRSIERAEAALDRFVTQREAAALAAVSKDTIARARQAGRFPHARLDGHTWKIPTADLAAAGLYDPGRFAPGRVDPSRDASPRPAQSETTAGPPEVPESPETAELARANARIAGLQDLVARQDAELAFLRQLATDTLCRKAAS